MLNKFLKSLGFRKRLYVGAEFSVRIKPGFRENVTVYYTRYGGSLKLDAERIGLKWEGIGLTIPSSVEVSKIQQIVEDLAIAFKSMDYEYSVRRSLGTERVSEAEQQAAIAELKQMGYEVKRLPSGMVNVAPLPAARQKGIEALRKEAFYMMSLVERVSGKVTRFETIAKSKDF